MCSSNHCSTVRRNLLIPQFGNSSLHLLDHLQMGEDSLWTGSTGLAAKAPIELDCSSSITLAALAAFAAPLSPEGPADVDCGFGKTRLVQQMSAIESSQQSCKIPASNRIFFRAAGKTEESADSRRFSGSSCEPGDRA